jgi:eukaryotic-like serine/threonine-protein kinase
VLTGKPVFEGQTLVEICAHHLYTEPIPPSQRAQRAIPAELEQLVLACLQKDPARRPDSAEALSGALEALTDVPAWTANDARAWWAERGRDVRRPSVPTPSLAVGATLAVDLMGRHTGGVAAVRR